MSKSIKTLQSQFKSTAVAEKELVDLRKENAALKATLDKVLKKVDELMSVDPDAIIQRGYSPEQEIIELQIVRLQAISRIQALSLDETRTLDLHLKNKRLIDQKIMEEIEAEWQDLSVDDLTGMINDEDDKITETEAPEAETSEESALEKGSASMETTRNSKNNI